MNQVYYDKIEARKNELQTLLVKIKADILELELNERRDNFKIRKEDDVFLSEVKKLIEEAEHNETFSFLNDTDSLDLLFEEYYNSNRSCMLLHESKDDILDSILALVKARIKSGNYSIKYLKSIKVPIFKIHKHDPELWEKVNKAADDVTE